MLSFFSMTIFSYIMILLSMAFFTLLERKMLGYFQIRKGPNKVSIMGIMQPIADALKLFSKESNKPTLALTSPFIMAPMANLMIALFMWNIAPSSSPSLYVSYSFLLFLCLSSMSVYTTLMAGWASNSKYALLGTMRSIAQTISYEISMSMTLIFCLLFISSLSLQTSQFHIKWNILLISPMIAFIWFTTMLAETNRSPFDFAEGESELVSGFNTEYSSNAFACIFMAEYINILFMSLITAILISNSFLTPMLGMTSLMIKTSLIASMFISVRASYPRIRYDQLMNMTWTSFLPISILLIIFFTPII